MKGAEAVSNERVDVLAVMDKAARDLWVATEFFANKAAKESGDEMAKARAAVAELIESAKAIKANPHVHLGDLIYEVREREGQGWEGHWVKQWSDAVYKFDKALSRIGGDDDRTP